MLGWVQSCTWDVVVSPRRWRPHHPNVTSPPHICVQIPHPPTNTIPSAMCEKQTITFLLEKKPTTSCLDGTIANDTQVPFASVSVLAQDLLGYN